MKTDGSDRDPGEGALEQLSQQVERGSLFTHTALSDNAERIQEVESFAYGLIDVLIKKGVLTEGEVKQATEVVRQEMIMRGDLHSPGIALRIDPPLPADAVEAPVVQVNCAERYPVCQAVCCKLNFALTAEEIEGGRVKWDLGRPYHIRHAASGSCVHLQTGSCRCGIYEDRPRICRSYSCAQDTRIWKDFEGMELNTEWISANLQSRGLQLITASMQPE